MAKKSKDTKTAASPNPEQLGKMIKSIYESGYLDKTTTYKMSFIKGMLGGLGGVLGATIVVALLLWILSLFDQAPLVGPFIDNIQHTVDQKSK